MPRKVIGIDLGTTNSVVAVMEGWAARRDREPGRRSNDAIGRRVRQGRRAARRSGREAAGRHESRAHHFLDQAFHGPPLRRGVGRSVARAVPDRSCRQGRCLGGRARPQVLAARDLRDGAAEVEAGRGGLSRRTGHGRRHHRAGVLQRHAASGDQGRRQDRGPQRPAHHQRADRGCAGLRARQEDQRNHRRLRLRRRHVRHLDPRGRRRRRRGEGHQRRHAPRRRRSRSARHRVARQRVQEDRGHRSVEGSNGAAALEGSGGEGQDRVVDGRRDRDQPAVHQRRSDGAEALRRQAVARKARTARRGPAPEDDGAGEAGAVGRRRAAWPDRRGRARRRLARACRGCSSW